VPARRFVMWKKPKIIEIAVGLEINSYACAELD
jgi:coenzyme PQQ precursor peptide PqqA